MFEPIDGAAQYVVTHLARDSQHVTQTFLFATKLYTKFRSCNHFAWWAMESLRARLPHLAGNFDNTTRMHVYLSAQGQWIKFFPFDTFIVGFSKSVVAVKFVDTVTRQQVEHQFLVETSL